MDKLATAELNRIAIVLSNVLALRACVERAAPHRGRAQASIPVSVEDHVRQLEGHATALVRLIRRSARAEHLLQRCGQSEYVAFMEPDDTRLADASFLAGACAQVASLVTAFRHEPEVRFDAAATTALRALSNDLCSQQMHYCQSGELVKGTGAP